MSSNCVCFNTFYATLFKLCVFLILYKIRTLLTLQSTGTETLYCYTLNKLIHCVMKPLSRWTAAHWWLNSSSILYLTVLSPPLIHAVPPIGQRSTVLYTTLDYATLTEGWHWGGWDGHLFWECTSSLILYLTYKQSKSTNDPRPTGHAKIYGWDLNGIEYDNLLTDLYHWQYKLYVFIYMIQFQLIPHHDQRPQKRKARTRKWKLERGKKCEEAPGSKPRVKLPVTYETRWPLGADEGPNLENVVPLSIIPIDWPA